MQNQIPLATAGVLGQTTLDKSEFQLVYLETQAYYQSIKRLIHLEFKYRSRAINSHSRIEAAKIGVEIIFFD